MRPRPRPADADWAQIADLYRRLAELHPSPVVALKGAVAVAMSNGPPAGLDLVDQLDRAGLLTGYHLVPATRADLLRRLGRHQEEAEAYRRALGLATSDADRRFLNRRLDELPR